MSKFIYLIFNNLTRWPSSQLERLDPVSRPRAPRRCGCIPTCCGQPASSSASPAPWPILRPAGLEAALDNFRRAGGLSISDHLRLSRGPFSTATVEDAILAGQAAAAAAARPAAEDKAMRRPNSSEAQRRPTSGLGRSEPRPPCYKYNLEGICGVAGCKLAHVCSACSGRHPVENTRCETLFLNKLWGNR
jgi:hypothetical protein